MLETLLRLLVVLGTIFAAGDGGLRLLCREKLVGALPERLGLSWVLGAGYVSLGLFFLGFLVSGPLLVGLLIAGSVALWVASRRIAVPAAPRTALQPAEWLVVGVLVAQVAVVAWCSINLVLGWDGLCAWEPRAAIAFAHGGTLPAEYFQDSTREWFHVRYPLGWPYLETWLYLCLGRVDQAWVRVLGALYYAAAAGLLGGAVTRLGGSRLGGLLIAAALFFLPMLTSSPYGYYAGYADFPIAVVFLAAATRLPNWHPEPRPADERLLAVLEMILVWQKSEGVLLLGVLLAAALLGLHRQKRWRRILLLAAPAVALLITFSLYLRAVHALPDENYFPVTVANLLGEAYRIAPILQLMARETVQWNLWSLLWPGALLAIVSLACRREHFRATTFLLLLGLPLPAIVLAYMMSSWTDFIWHIFTSLSRLLLQLAPVALLAIGLALPPPVRTAED